MTVPHQVLRFGVLSTASIVSKLLPAFAACAAKPFTATTTTTTTSTATEYSVQLVAVASRSLEKAQQYADANGIPTAYGSYEELLADPQIDALYIPLPNALHKEWVIKAIQSGKHVLIEKPITLCAKDIVDIEREVKAFELKTSRRLVVMEAFMAVHLQQTQQVLDAILQGAIGDVEGFYGQFTFPNARLSGRDAPVVEGGGSLWDIGCYPIAVTRCILSGLQRARVAAIEDNADFTCDVASVSGVATQIGRVVDGSVVLGTDSESPVIDWSRYHDRSFAGTLQFAPGSGIVMPRSDLNAWDAAAVVADPRLAISPTLQFTSGFNSTLRRQLIIQGTLGRITMDNAYHAANTDSFTLERSGETPAASRSEFAAVNMKSMSSTVISPAVGCPSCMYTTQLQNFTSKVFAAAAFSTVTTALSSPATSSDAAPAVVKPSARASDLLTLTFSRRNVAVIEELYRCSAMQSSTQYL